MNYIIKYCFYCNLTKFAPKYDVWGLVVSNNILLESKDISWKCFLFVSEDGDVSVDIDDGIDDDDGE